MKKTIMQKMNCISKVFQKVILCIVVSMTVVSCLSSSDSGKKSDTQASDAQALQDSLLNSNTLLNQEEVTEGLVPPVNKNILMPYYVQAGDNLVNIAKKIYGDRSAWRVIANLNNLINPHKIYAGDVLYYMVTDQSKGFSQVYENAPRAKIVVKKGDTLSFIAKSVFGKSKDWRVLWKENPHIKNPDRLKVGEVVYFRPKALTSNASKFVMPHNSKPENNAEIKTSLKETSVQEAKSDSKSEDKKEDVQETVIQTN